MYKKPNGLLLATPIQRREPKSQFLLDLEAFQESQKPKLVEEENFLQSLFEDNNLHNRLRLVRK